SLARMIGDQRAASDPARTGEAEPGYVVTGSAQRNNDGNLRVNVQITDTTTAKYKWAGRYEISTEDFSVAKVEITRQISRELHLLVLQEASRKASAATGSEIAVPECLARASEALKGRITPDLTAEAQVWLLSALAIEPRNVEALTSLAF